MDAKPSEILEQNGWWHRLTFQINTTAFYGKLMYIYSKNTEALQQFSTTLNTQDVSNFPLQSFPLKKEDAKMIYLVKPFGTWKTEIQIDLHIARKCCNDVAFSFGVTSITKSGNALHGMEWNGMAQNGMEFNGIKIYSVLFFFKKHQCVVTNGTRQIHRALDSTCPT